MTSFVVTALVVAGLMVTPSEPLPDADVYAPQTEVAQARGACDRAIEQALEMTGGELLSVQPARNGKPNLPRDRSRRESQWPPEKDKTPHPNGLLAMRFQFVRAGCKWRCLRFRCSRT